MPIAYLCLLLLAFLASRFHWPLIHLPVLLGVLLMLADSIVQLVRLLLNKTHFSTVLGAFALTLLSISYAFLWLLWPARHVVGYTALFLVAGYFIYWLISKRRITVRFCITALLFLSVILGVQLKTSTIMRVKYNIDLEDPQVPLYIKHELSWFLSQGEKRPLAERYLTEERQYIRQKLRSADKKDKQHIVLLKRDSVLIEQAFNELTAGKWEHFEGLIPIDSDGFSQYGY